VQVKIREGSPEGIRVNMEERICERDEFYVWSDRSRETQGVTDGENEGDDCDEVICAG